MNLELLHRGSVKDIYQVSDDELLFRFSNRYSIFDWGEMPDAIPGKGAALCTMGKKLLSHLETRGFRTHYLGSGERPEDFRVRSVKVPRDDISVYQSRPSSILIPLEVIYRFGAPKGSSLLKKYKTEEEWIHAGFDRKYSEGEFFTEVKLDFTTKLERLDRVLTPAEAKNLSGMNDAEWKSLLETTKSVAMELKHVFRSAGLTLWDGKIEFAFDESREIMLVDSVGLDEIRLTYDGAALSKELLRQFYLDSSWYQALTRAKEHSTEQFKEYCVQELKESPKPLPEKIIQAISKVYTLVGDLLLNEKEEETGKLKQELSTALKTLEVSR